LNGRLSKTERIVRFIIALFFGGLGFTGGMFFVLSSFYRIMFQERSLWLGIVILSGLTVLTLAIGFMIGPFLIRQTERLIRWWETKLVKIPTADLMGAVFGLIIGLIIASLIGPSLSWIPFVGPYLPLLISILLGYLGLSLGMKKREEIFNLNRFRNLGFREKKKEAKQEGGGGVSAEMPAAAIFDGGDQVVSPEAGFNGVPKILDTSVIIDGRVSDIYQTGFLSGTIVIPRFVLTELQHIADSSDGLKRNRGRRGLDILNNMRKGMQGDIQVIDADFPETTEVDAKLVLLAQQINGDILTNDYNLNKVAELQGVRVLNINDLVNALKPVFLPGEEMVVHVIKEGKEQRQGIGYLDDGTMIVVDLGKKYINQTIYTIVTSVLQTSAGRMIFVKPKFTDKRVFAEGD
jgi:uncharacterized protein YacL